jgi:hypothetical protein
MRMMAGAAALMGLLLAGGGVWAADLEGKVQMVVIAERMVVLEDGKQVWMAEGLSMEELKEVRRSRWSTRARRKLVATSVEIVK